MSSGVINTEAEKDAYVQIWKYLSANGRIFVPVENTENVAAVYVEDSVEEGKKTVRTFMDAQAIELYIIEVENHFGYLPPGSLKAGMVPVKLLQEQLTEIYGTTPKDGITVECMLTSYGPDGNMKDLDVIWSQNNN